MLKTPVTAAVLLAAVASRQPLTAPSTELVIHAVDEDGAPVALTRADVYLDLWNGGDLVPLPRDGSSVTVPLDPSSPCTDHQLCAGNRLGIEGARLILDAWGLAPITSDHFDWPDAPDKHTSQLSTTIMLPGSAPLIIRYGSTSRVTLRFRPTRRRTLQVVTTSGEPATDASVSIKNFFSAQDHSGVPKGESLLDRAAVDDRGQVRFPDGDVEYAFEVHAAHAEIASPKPATWPFLVFTRVDGAVQTLVVRRHARRPLLLELLKSGIPLSNTPVRACAVPCLGACCGQLGTTDGRGWLTVTNFYPEELDRIFVPSGKTDSSHDVLWQADPRTFTFDGTRQTIDITR